MMPAMLFGCVSSLCIRMELDTKLGMSLDDLIKTDKDTKMAVKQTRFRGRDNRSARPRAPGVRKEVRKPESRRKDSDAEMTDVRKTNKIIDSRRNKKFADKPKAPLRAKVVLSGKKKEEKRKVRITNIPYDVNWRDVKEAFAKTVAVERCDVEKGEAVIIFGSHADALKAINTYNGGNMNGRVIKAFFD